MTEQLIISIVDVLEHERIDPKFDTHRFYAYLQTVQRINLRDLLKPSLYLDLFNNYSATKYTELIEGKEYELNGDTVQFFGLKPALVFWWLAEATRRGEAFLSGYGMIQFVDNQQQNFEIYRGKDKLAASYMQHAAVYANDVTQFLNENQSTYPLWEGGRQRNKTNFVSFRI